MESEGLPSGSRVLGGNLAITNAIIYVSPDAAPIERGTVLIRDGQVTQVGAGVSIPSGTPVLDAHQGALTAGFWNAHVHFTEAKWASPNRQAAEALNHQLADMLTSRGFTTVVDAGSNPRATFALRRRIEAGELHGPAIYTAGSGIYPPRGIPYYVKDSMPRYFRWFMPQPSTPSAAARIVSRNLTRGADLVKLFTGSYVRPGKVLPMPEAIAKAAVEAAHSYHRLVYAHPSNLAGTLVAQRSGVDVLAHAPDTTVGIDDAVLQSIVDRRMAMIPTLKMFGTTVTPDPAYLQAIYHLVLRFRELGGEVLFGTDVGYMHDYSTEGEFEALRQSGLDAMATLRALTTAPAERFGIANAKGTISPGKQADLTLLDGDPLTDFGAFARVRSTVREGRVIWSHP